MKLNLCIAIIFCLHLNMYGQNMVSNPSFEQSSACPTTLGLVAYCNSWSDIGSADYFNDCSTGLVSVPANSLGTQSAFYGGHAYAGFATYSTGYPYSYKEYLCTTIPAMTPGKRYEVSMSVSLADNSFYATNDIGVYLYHNGIHNQGGPVVLPVTPQVSYSASGPITDKINWTRLSANYVADSAYDNVIIGGFKDNSTVQLVPNQGGTGPYAYYYIDSVSIRLAPNIRCNYTDTAVCPGDTINVPYTLYLNAYLGNVFTVQLSSTSGSFANPVDIGSVTSFFQGIIKAVIPVNITPGTGYRIRIVGGAPKDTSDDNGSNIHIKPLPAKLITTANSPVCSGSVLNLSATTSTAGVTWSWSGPASFTSNLQSTNRGAMQSAWAGNYFVAATLAGCTTKDTVAVSVNPTPPAPVAGSNNPACIGGNINFTASSVPGATFDWSGPLFKSSLPNPSRTNITVNDAGTYYVKAISNGCTSAVTPVSVSVIFGPVVSIYPNPNDTICIGSTASLAAVPGNPNASLQFQWYKNSTPIPNTNKINYTSSSIVNDDTFIVTMLDPSSACTTPIASNKIVMTVLDTVKGPSVTITVDPDTSVWAGLQLKFTASPAGCNGNVTYQWYGNGKPIKDATTNPWLANHLSDGTVITCVVKCHDWCPVPDTAVSNKLNMHVSTGIGEMIASSKLGIYPNPNDGDLTVKFYDPSGIIIGSHIEVINALGQVVYHLGLNVGQLSAVLALHDAANGIYLLRLYRAGETYTTRFVVNK